MNAPNNPAVRDPGEAGIGTVYTLLAACGFAAVSTLYDYRDRRGRRPHGRPACGAMSLAPS